MAQRVEYGVVVICFHISIFDISETTPIREYNVMRRL